MPRSRPRLPNGQLFDLCSFGRSFLLCSSSRGSRARARRLLAAVYARWPDAVVERDRRSLAVYIPSEGGCCAVMLRAVS